jgi:hypothetical protein
MQHLTKSIPALNAAEFHGVAVPSKPQCAIEGPYYTVKEIAALLKLSPDTVRRLFRNEPGVLALGNTGRRGKRRHVTLRIPQAVLEQVYQQITLW